MKESDKLIRALALINTCLIRGEDAGKIYEAKDLITSVLKSEALAKGENV